MPVSETTPRQEQMTQPGIVAPEKEPFHILCILSIAISLGNEHDGFVVLTRPIAREPSCPAVVG